MPNKNTNPLLEYPVELTQSFQTKLFDACPVPLVVGMAAQTMILIKTPAMVKNPPSDSNNGIARFAKSTIAKQSQVTTMKLTKTCHCSASKSGWKAAYMETVWAPTIWQTEASAISHPKKFHQPAKKPQTRP